jgi:hypothetical protein
MKKVWAAAAMLSAVIAAPATAAWNAAFTGSITMIEPSYVPSHVVFTSNSGTGACASGALLAYYARGITSDEKIANIQAILAMLQTPQLTGRGVDLFVDTTNCSVEFLHFR